MSNRSQQHKGNPNKKTAREEIKDKIISWYHQFIAWIKPDKTQSVGLQILFFILKIPVILLALMCSPILLIILVLVLFLAL